MMHRPSAGPFDWEREGLADEWPTRIVDRGRLLEIIEDEEWRLDHGFPAGYTDPEGVMLVTTEPGEPEGDDPGISSE